MEDYEGPGVIETYTIPFDRKGHPRHATIIGRTPQGDRFLAHVPGDDVDMLQFLTSQDQSVGSPGYTHRYGDKLRWAALSTQGATQ